MPLNRYATKVRAAVLQTLPRLGQYLDESGSGALVLRVPHPRIPSGLILSTQGDEVSVGLGVWHTHGELLGGSSPEEHIQSALALVHRILEGDVQLVVRYLDGEFEDAWVTDDPDREDKYIQPNESLVIGTWAELAA